MSAVDGRADKEEAGGFGDPPGRRDEELALVLALDDEQAIEANVVDVDAIWEVAA